MAYQVKWADGGARAAVDTLAEAVDVVEGRYPRAYYSDNGDASDRPSERELREAGRVLVWADAAAADGPDGNGDDGANAVAEIVPE